MSDVQPINRLDDKVVGDGQTSAKRRILPRLMLFVATILIALFLGFLAFLSSVNEFSENQTTVNADGIVVLTGGFARLEPAVRLLKEKRGERLLISGVNPKTNDALLQDVLKVDDELYNCCIDIDQDALDTIGNAVGTAHWVASKDYKSIIVVTNDYHMPRSLMELRRTLGDVDLAPYAVRNELSQTATLIGTADRYRVLVGEYGKYLASLGRGVLGGDMASTTSFVSGQVAGW